MKLRIQADSIRFRVTPTELHALATRGIVESAIQMGGSTGEQLRYMLESSPKSSSVRLTYASGVIRVTIPESVVRQWASTEQVGIEAVQQVSGDTTLKILIEKDFKCLQPRTDESEVDRFPNPAEESR